MHPASSSGLLRTGGSSRSVGTSRSVAGKDLDGSKMLLSVNWRFLKTTDPEESIRATASRGSMMSQGSMTGGGGGVGRGNRGGGGGGTSSSVRGMPSYGDGSVAEESVVSVTGEDHDHPGGGGGIEEGGGIQGNGSGSSFALPSIHGAAAAAGGGGGGGGGRVSPGGGGGFEGVEAVHSHSSGGGLAGTPHHNLSFASSGGAGDGWGGQEAAMRAGEAMQSESRLFTGGASLSDAEVFEDDDDGAIGKIMRVRFAREKLGAPPPLPRGKLEEKDKALLTKLFNKRAGIPTNIFDVVKQATKGPQLGTFRSMSRKVNEATQFTMQLRDINAARMASFTAKPKTMMSEMEIKLQEVDRLAEALDLESMSKEELRQMRVRQKLVDNSKLDTGSEDQGNLTGEEQRSALEGVQKARRSGAVNLDFAIEETRSTSPVFSWRPMERVILATELPLELFEDMDEEVDRHVLHAEAAMRQKDVASMPTVAELAAPIGGAEWRNSRVNGLKVGTGIRGGGEGEGGGGDGDGDGEGGDDQDLMDEELARELARNRRNRAQEMSERYDFNIAQAAGPWSIHTRHVFAQLKA